MAHHEAETESKMINRASRALVAVVAGVLLTVAGSTGAYAATLYNNNNYTPSAFWSGTTTVGNSISASNNDTASSLKSAGVTRKYCENDDCTGRVLTTANDYNSLGSTSIGLNVGETWSDRISGVR